YAPNSAERSVSLVLSWCPPVCDPDDDARERAGFSSTVSMWLLGARFRFVSDSPDLLRLVCAAYEGLPQHRWPASFEFLVELHLLPRGRRHSPDEPSPLQTHEMAGALCGLIDASNYALVMPARRRALVVASEDMLEHAQHLRQELIEFAVFILATRAQGLVPLHAGCFGAAGRGLLLLGNGGAGKSTLALQAFLHGMELLSEDAVFVRPDGMLATGIANYLHMRTDAALFSEDGNVARWIRRSPVIRRNSGVMKFEIDPRQGCGRLAPVPLRLCASVFVSAEPAERPDRPLRPLDAEEAAAMLRADQAYAATQPGWECFIHRLKQLGAYRLQRGDPATAIAALRRLLG
ncbi:MAG: serine kinase, partial [Rhodanobacteraceae bacterium]